jgi:hypothetical protein
VATGFFADVNHLAPEARPFHEFGMDEVVVHEHIGLGDELLGAKRDEPEITGPGADEVNDAGRHKAEKVAGIE